MASPLIYIFFFIIFLLVTYYFMYYPTNKLQLSVTRLNLENQLLKKRDDVFPSSLNTLIFLNNEKFIPSTVNTYYNSSSGTVTVVSDNKKRVFRLDFDEDVRTLLPILLLSK
ncbi:hypothetical protein DpV84gp061 [Deerpox virus W-1170-84]|uniref:Entry-fusion complex protein OPG086 n=1 Tax=Deerpox virus (strain W-1170-84) TaxID=305676 RepID=Q08FC2_DPV84|nr:hypothetical protein DpV84gp061 [Deerpox virus W-1170-84]AYC44762.1 hypothetical protein [Moosepox virus GoldyGopher14]